MMDDKREHWRTLCERAAKEEDPEKLMALCLEINRLLEERERQLKAKKSDAELT